MQGGQDRLVARLGVDVGSAGGEVDGADRVADDRLHLPEGHVVLVIFVASDQAVATGFEEIGGEVDIAPVPGGAAKFDQGQFDLFVAVGAGSLAGLGRSEGLDEQIGEAGGDGQQRCLAGGPEVGNGSLDQVSGAVELVGASEFGPTLGELSGPPSV